PATAGRPRSESIGRWPFHALDDEQFNLPRRSPRAKAGGVFSLSWRRIIAVSWSLEQRDADRRAANRRHNAHDRRSGEVAKRLRKGLWFAFYRHTELAKSDRFPPNL